MFVIKEGQELCQAIQLLKLVVWWRSWLSNHRLSL